MTESESLLSELRPVAFGVAHRMFGSVSTAEDVVRETLLRVHRLAITRGPQVTADEVDQFWV